MQLPLMKPLISATTANFHSWKKEEVEIRSLFDVAIQNPFQIHPTLEHYYGFLFLCEVHKFYDPLKFQNEIRRLFDKVAEYPKDDGVIILISSLRSYFPQSSFPHLLTDAQLEKVADILDEIVEIPSQPEEREPSEALKTLKRILPRALKEYATFIEQISKQNSQGWARFSPYHSHGPEGLAKARQFGDLISAVADVRSANNIIKDFFNVKTTACRDHSFISFFLDAIAEDREFFQQTTVYEILKGINKGMCFKISDMEKSRSQACDILHCKGLFNS